MGVVRKVTSDYVWPGKGSGYQRVWSGGVKCNGRDGVPVGMAS